MKPGALGGVAVAAILAAGLLLAGAPASPADPPQITVYKNSTCKCCTRWEAHLERHGFAVESIVVSDVRPLKVQNGIRGELAACHTAFVGGYVVEGHVPAADILRLLEEKPAIAGLAVPGMPVGSPGMEGPDPVAYDVIAFDGTGRRVSIFATHEP